MAVPVACSRPILRELGHDRSVYAPDLPGHGSSDAASSKATVADLAAAIGDFIDSLRLRSVDLAGYQLGALIAAELAIARPQLIRRVLLWGVPSYSRAGSSRAFAKCTFSGLARRRQRRVGRVASHVWNVAGRARPIGAMADEFGDRLRAGTSGAQCLRRDGRVPGVGAPAAGEAVDAGAAIEG